MESIFGGLVEFENSNEFDKFTQNMSKEESLMVLEKAVQYCQQTGMFDLMESTVLYKCLIKLKEDADKD